MMHFMSTRQADLYSQGAHADIDRVQRGCGGDERRFRFGPPKAIWVTVSGTRIFPIISAFRPDAMDAVGRARPDVAVDIDPKAIGHAGIDNGECSARRQLPFGGDVERHDLMRALLIVRHARVGDIQDLLIGRKGKAVRFAKLVGRDRDTAALQVDAKTGRRPISLGALFPV